MPNPNLKPIDPGTLVWEFTVLLLALLKNHVGFPLFKNGSDAERTGVVANLNFFYDSSLFDNLEAICTVNSL